MNKFDLKNKLAVITGGAQGFGLAMTQRFLESGANVIIWDFDKSAVEKTIKKLNNKKLSSTIIDVTKFDHVLTEVEKEMAEVGIFGLDAKKKKILPL